jgi:GT2 family glycosyltransferase
MHIRIATPMYGGNCKGIYVDSIIGLTFQLAQLGHQVSFSKIYNESLITRARNNLAKEFLDSDADYLFFVDADEGFNVDDVVKMIESGKDLIGGVYPMKNINWENVRKAAIAGKENLSDYSGIFAMNFLPGETSIRLNEPIEVSEVATGLMLISRKVFEKMEPHCLKYAMNGSDAQFDFNNMVTEFFATSITPEGVLLSEDYHFCRKWREIGGQVYAAPWVTVVHAGDYVFSGRFAADLEMNAQRVE